MIKFLIVLLAAIPSFAAHHTNPDDPSVPGGDGDYKMTDLTLRYFDTRENSRWMYEIKARDSFDHIIQYHFMAGPRFNVARGQKLGFYIKGEVNERHDDNWILKDGDWVWEESGDVEITLMPEWIVRRMLTNSIRAELRLRYAFNATEDLQTLKIRPSLTYFQLKNGKPFLNWFLMYEKYRPLNYGNGEEFQSWTYFGVLYHWKRHNKIALSASVGSWTWTQSDEWEDLNPSEHYDVYDDATIYGLTHIWSY